METEYEAKFYPVNKSGYRKKLKGIGAKLIVPERRMLRAIADFQANKFLTKYEHVRVRDEGGLVRLSYKKSASMKGKISDQKEVDVVVSDFNKTLEILKRVGVKFNGFQETLREEWSYKKATITIDTWPGLESYSEIEADSEEYVEKIAKELGLDWNKRMVAAAVEVYAKVYGIGVEEVLDKLTNITFKNNPFKNLTRKWNG